MCASVLILVDIHHRHPQIDTIVGWEDGVDLIVCTGDLFDQSGDDAQTAHDTAVWYKGRLNDPRWVFALGNHDQSYHWPTNPHALCSGFTEAKAHAINAVLTEADWSLVRPYYAFPDWNLLLTHAGFDRHLPTLLASHGFASPPANPTLRQLTDYLDAEWPHVCIRYSSTDSHHPLLCAGRGRGGHQTIGGITWQDYQEHSPIPGLIQIVGHTIGDIPLWRFHQGTGVKAPMWRRADKGPIRTDWLATGATLDLDTSTHHYAILDTETGTLSIRQVHWHSAKTVGQPRAITQGRIISTVQLPRAGEVATGPIDLTPDAETPGPPIRDGGWNEA